MGKLLTSAACDFDASRAPAGGAGVRTTAASPDAFNAKFASLCPDISKTESSEKTIDEIKTELKEILNSYIKDTNILTAKFKKEIADQLNRDIDTKTTPEDLGALLEATFLTHQAQCLAHKTSYSKLEVTLVDMGGTLARRVCDNQQTSTLFAVAAKAVTEPDFDKTFKGLCPNIHAQHEADCISRAAMAAAAI